MHYLTPLPRPRVCGWLQLEETIKAATEEIWSIRQDKEQVASEEAALETYFKAQGDEIRALEAEKLELAEKMNSLATQVGVG